MKKFLLNRIREGEFNPDPAFKTQIQQLNLSYDRAKTTIKNMHGEDAVTFEESMTREFRAYTASLNKIQLDELNDERKKLTLLRHEFKKLFGVDAWDDVTLNYEFNTLEELYDCYKLYVRNYHA